MENERKKENKKNRAKNIEEAVDIVKTVIQTVSELIPLFMEKWSMVKDKPLWKEIQDDQRRIKLNLHKIIKKQNLYMMFFFLLLVWNCMLTLIIILKNQ